MIHPPRILIETTPKLRSILETSGRITVEVTEHPEQCDAAACAKYDALLNNWNAFDKPTVTNWPAVHGSRARPVTVRPMSLR